MTAHDGPSLDGRVRRNYFRFAQWDITSRCNLQCIHCRSRAFYGHRDLARDLSLDSVLVRLRELARGGVRRIHFLGGEPLCRKDLPDIIRCATDLGILCSVNTNGTLLTPELSAALIQAGTFLVTFSIDGPDAATNDAIRGLNTFHEVTRGVRDMREARDALGARVRLICSHVLMRPNYHAARRMIGLCADLGLQNLIVTGLRRTGAAETRYEDLALSLDEHMQAAEDLAQHHAALRPPCNLQIDIVGLLARCYLNAKYGARQHTGRSGCNTIVSKVYCQPDGTIFPCQEMALQLRGSKERQELAEEGTGALDSDRFGALERSLASGKVYRRYTPCNACPALGRLCMPCPLPGLRGREYVSRECRAVIDRAQREGIDLFAEVERAVASSARDRLLDDPAFRHEFFTESDPSGVLAALGTASSEQVRLRAFRDETLDELQALIRRGACRLGGEVAEGVGMAGGEEVGEHGDVERDPGAIGV